MTSRACRRESNRGLPSLDVHRDISSAKDNPQYILDSYEQKLRWASSSFDRTKDPDSDKLVCNTVVNKDVPRQLKM